MKNGYSIVWTENANSELIQIINYIYLNFGEHSIRKFVKKIESCIQKLSSMPNAFPKSIIKKDLRRYVISKQITIYYKLIDDNIFIVSIFDNRRNFQD